MQNTDLAKLDETAHAYMECSNKGTCDRTSGDCTCFEGYEGNSCQRTVCPNSCSGHGICKTKAQLAVADYGNTYNLWDKDVAQGCQCDAGYTGPDCSLKICKYDIDPLYLDDSATVKYSEFNLAVLTNSPSALDFTDNYNMTGQTGRWAIRFFDHKGEDWLTQAIPSNAQCSDVVSALESLPNKVIPSGSILCYHTSKTNKLGYDWSSINNNTDESGDHYAFNNKRPYFVQYSLSLWDANLGPDEVDELSPQVNKHILPGSYAQQAYLPPLSGHIYRLLFTGNPGAIKQPEIEIYLDGNRPTIVSTNGKLITKVWTDGAQGEDNDYFADHCDNVRVQVLNDGNSNPVTYLGGFTSEDEKATLKRCLADSDFDKINNVDIYNWDHGNRFYPHFIKLVRTVSSYLDGSYYAALYFDPDATNDDGSGTTTGNFILLNPIHTPDFKSSDSFEVYTTSGTLALTTKDSGIIVYLYTYYVLFLLLLLLTKTNQVLLFLRVPLISMQVTIHMTTVQVLLMVTYLAKHQVLLVLMVSTVLIKTIYLHS